MNCQGATKSKRNGNGKGVDGDSADRYSQKMQASIATTMMLVTTPSQFGHQVFHRPLDQHAPIKNCNVGCDRLLIQGANAVDRLSHTMPPSMATTTAPTPFLAHQDYRRSTQHHSPRSYGRSDGPLKQVPPFKCVALDCEMVGVGPNNVSVLARVSMVDFHGVVLFDSYVRVDEKVSDYRTAVSGIRPGDLESRKARPFGTCRDIVLKILRGKMLVGHALQNDLAALNISRPWWKVRDTSCYIPFMKAQGRGVLYKPRRLRELSKDFLGTVIQEGQHNSIEDARAAMMLYRLYKARWDHEVEMTRREIAFSSCSPGTLFEEQCASLFDFSSLAFSSPRPQALGPRIDNHSLLPCSAAKATPFRMGLDPNPWHTTRTEGRSYHSPFAASLGLMECDIRSIESQPICDSRVDNAAGSGLKLCLNEIVVGNRDRLYAIDGQDAIAAEDLATHVATESFELV